MEEVGVLEFKALAVYSVHWQADIGLPAIYGGALRLRTCGPRPAPPVLVGCLVPPASRCSPGGKPVLVGGPLILAVKEKDGMPSQGGPAVSEETSGKAGGSGLGPESGAERQ